MRKLDAYVANESIRGMCSPLNSYVLTKKQFRLWSCSLFFCTAAHFHFAGRYSISHFLTAAKKVFMLFFFNEISLPCIFLSL